MRTIFIADIHGCLEEFRELLELVTYKQGNDRLILLGDLVDRGPDPIGVVRLAQEIQAELIQGNHENKHIRYRKHEKANDSGKKNPVVLFPKIQAEHALLSDQDLEWMEKAPAMIRVSPNLIAVHAGLETAYSADNQRVEILNRIRYVNGEGRMVSLKHQEIDQPKESYLWATKWKGPESVIYGHAIHSLKLPRIDTFEGGLCVGLDTGCVFGGRLSAFILEETGEWSISQVQAKKRYYGNGISA